jgi:hypothetical protein
MKHLLNYPALIKSINDFEDLERGQRTFNPFGNDTGKFLEKTSVVYIDFTNSIQSYFINNYSQENDILKKTERKIPERIGNTLFSQEEIKRRNKK